MTFEWTDNVNYLFFYFLITIFLFTKGIYFFLNNPKYQVIIAKLFILLIVICLSIYGVKQSIINSEKISASAMEDTQELFVLNAAYNYLEKGFDSNFGLPDLIYFDSESIKQMPNGNNDLFQKTRPHVIYTHCSIGQYWLAGLFVKYCGRGNLSCLRLLSTSTGIFALFFFAIMLFHTYGPLKSAVLMFFVAIIPMTSNGMYIFTETNFSFSLFIIQLGLLLHLFKNKIRLGGFNLAALAVLGFIQGWLSCEYFFLTILSPLPLAILYSQNYKKDDSSFNVEIQKSDKQRLVLITLFLVAGYCSAFLLHFIQNSLYFGNTREAFRDLFDVAKSRLSDTDGRWWVGRNTLLLYYFFVFPRNFNFFIINFPILVGLTFIIIWLKELNITIRKPIQVKLKWTSSRRNFLVILSALLASFLWIFTMSYNSSLHIHLFPRLIFFAYFICILTLLECVSLDNS